MTKGELSTYLTLLVISGLLIGVAVGIFIMSGGETNKNLFYLFLLSGLGLNMIGMFVFGKKYNEFTKSLK